MRLFRKVLGGIALVCTVVSTSALADGPSVVSGKGNWSGAYFGINGGWLGSTSDWVYPNGNSPDTIDFSSGIFGAHIGLQYQFGSLVVGVEGALSLADGDLDGGSCPNAAFNCIGRVNKLATIGPRLGWSFHPGLLVFVSGGYAHGRIETETRNAVTGVLFDSSASSHSGWFIGGGGEFALTPNLVLGLEYQRVDLQEKSVAPTPFAAGEVRNNLGAEIDVVRARLSIKFGP